MGVRRRRVLTKLWFNARNNKIHTISAMQDIKKIKLENLCDICLKFEMYADRFGADRLSPHRIYTWKLIQCLNINK